MRKIPLSIALVAALAGCGLRRVENVQTPYVASEYLPYAQPGTARIAGGVAERVLAGQVMTCAGRDVMLTPATSYGRAAIDILKAGKRPGAGASGDSRALMDSTTKRSSCDAQGKFAFDRLAAGTWILLVSLSAPDDDWETGAMIREITVAAGETVTVALTDEDFTPR